MSQHPSLKVSGKIRKKRNVLKRFEESTDLGEIIDERYTVSDKIEYLLAEIKPGQSIPFLSLFESVTTKAEMIVTFLAVLELMKMNQFQVHQPRLLGEIELRRKALQ